MNQQLDFFGSSPAYTLVRDLSGVSGLWYFEGFLPVLVQQVLLRRVDEHPWMHDLKRRVQHYGYKYDYRARSIDRSMAVEPLPEFALDVARRLIEIDFLRKLPDQLIVNEYEPGQGITAHVDCEPCFEDRVVTVSLGSRCVMEFTRKSEPARTALLQPGSALLLHGEARYAWTHAIRARLTDDGIARGRRVSLTFRNVILQDFA